MSEARPYSKETQLARGERRHHRRKASPGTWQRIIDAKRGPCRICGDSPVEYHHLVPRSQGGDDTAANIVPLCRICHARVEVVDRKAVDALVRSLSVEELSYTGWVLR